MDLIKELVQFIAIAEQGAISQYIPQGTKILQLFSLVQKNPDISSKEAANIIYKSAPTDKKFMMLKRNLINKLVEIVLISDSVENGKNYQRIQFECDKKIAVAKKLVYTNVFHNAEKMMLKVIKQAKEFDLVGAQMESAIVLRKINELKGTPDQVSQYQNLILHLTDEFQKMQEGRGFIELTNSMVKYTRSQNEQIANETLKYSIVLGHSYESFNNIFFKLFEFQLLLVHHFHMLDYTSLSATVDDFESFLDANKKLKSKQVLLQKELMKLNLTLCEKRNAEAQKQISKLIKQTSFQAFDQYEIQAYHFELKLRNNKLQDAVAILQSVSESSHFEELYLPDKAAWAIRSAYLYVVSLAYKKKYEIPAFNFQDLPAFYFLCSNISKDKLGYNLQYLIIRTILIWLKGGMDFDSECNNLKVYYQRYVKHTHCKRSKRFFKLLEKLTRYRFDKLRFNFLTSQLIDEFEEMHRYIDFNEIITYEQLWIVIGKLIERQSQGRL